MRALAGSGTLLALNIRAARYRAGSAIVVLVAFAIAVIVFLSVFEMARGFDDIIRSSARSDRLILLQQGSTAEVTSSITREQVRELQTLTNVALSPELVTAIRVHTQSADSVALIPLRALEPDLARVRPEVRIVAGRQFTPGRYEVIVGKALAEEFTSLRPGGEVTLKGRPWRIVGVFASEGNSHESEIFADLRMVAGELQKESVSSVSLRLGGALATRAAVEALLAARSHLPLAVQTESAYYDNQSRRLREVLRFLAYGIGVVMALGAFFAALNAMYSSVEARRMELGTLRAIGARPASLLVSIVFQSLLFGGAGALLGVAASWLLFDGRTFSTLGESEHLTQLVVQMHVPATAMLLSIIGGCAIGAVAGLVPALTAVWVRPTAALRAT